MSDEEPICTCDEADHPWPTAPCPIHGLSEILEPNEYGQNHVTVTDEHLMCSSLSSFSGYIFKCPKCDQPAIMSYFNFCPNCGTKVVLQSVTIRNIIRQTNKGTQQ